MSNPSQISIIRRCCDEWVKQNPLLHGFLRNHMIMKYQRRYGGWELRFRWVDLRMKYSITRLLSKQNVLDGGRMYVMYELNIVRRQYDDMLTGGGHNE
jgi:hypothetical protein